MSPKKETHGAGAWTIKSTSQIALLICITFNSIFLWKQKNIKGLEGIKKVRMGLECVNGYQLWSESIVGVSEMDLFCAASKIVGKLGSKSGSLLKWSTREGIWTCLGCEQFKMNYENVTGWSFRTRVYLFIDKTRNQ